MERGAEQLSRRGWAALVIIAACGGEARPRAGDTAAAADTSPRATAAVDSAATRVELSPVFDPAKIRPGDAVAGLTVSRVDVHRAYDSTLVGNVRFGGEITLDGTLRPHHDFPENRSYCFDVDSSSVARLPRWPAETRRVWLCFSNDERAAQLLGAPGATRRVRVVVDDYQTVRHYSDAVDEAMLVRVIERADP